jgi:2-dehydropantoate 2-reductase
MQDIQKVAILGAGAMGAYFATRFFESPGFSTVLIAEGQRLHRLKQDGLVVNGKHYMIPAISPAEAAFPGDAVDPAKAANQVDLVIVALKHHHLAEAIRDLGGLVGEATTFLSVMNGLESEERIGAIYGREKVLYAISLGIDAVRSGNQVSYTKPGVHYFGEAKNITISPKVRRVQEAFGRAGIRYETPEDMLRWLWWKFMVNVGVNQASAVMRAPYGFFQCNPDAKALMEALMQEVVRLAKAENVSLSQGDIDNWYPVLNQLSPQGKTSMLQDIEAKRKTEVEVFSGKVIALGKAHGIPTPVNQTIFQIIRILEQG